jgi:tRNA A37 threonylcarbamoyladenosine dehydratase
MNKMFITIIGLGGVGSILVERLCRFINYSSDIIAEILLVDGDAYEMKNYERQEFNSLGNKAEIKADELELKFSNIQFDTVPHYINQNNIDEIIQNLFLVGMK